MNILECSSKGDKRFSALYAKIELFDKVNTIENFYQSSKVILINNKRQCVTDWRKSKGQNIYGFVLNNMYFEPKYISSFYKLMWVKYLDNNKDLVQYAKQFDDFNDMFKSKKSYVCQADVVKQYVLNGRKSFFEDTLMKEFLNLLKQSHQIRYVNISLLKGDLDIYGHQTNCLGYMGKGIALEIKKQYPLVYKTYKEICNKTSDKEKLLGRTLLIDSNGNIVNKEINDYSNKIIANIFGQNNIKCKSNNYSKQTQEESVKKALIELKEFAKENYLWIGIPYKMGCMNGGGNWKSILNIIQEVFVDYPITIYKYNE